jgi:hypothetical protein
MAYPSQTHLDDEHHRQELVYHRTTGMNRKGRGKLHQAGQGRPSCELPHNRTESGPRFLAPRLAETYLQSHTEARMLHLRRADP